MDYMSILQLILEILIFMVLIYVFKWGLSKLRKSSSRFLNPREYLPEEEIHSLRQIFYLMMMGLIFVDILYAVVLLDGDIIYFVIFDIVLSLYIASKLDTSSLKNKILIILLVPYGSLTYLLFGSSLVGFFDLLQVPVLIYFIKVYFDKFMRYTESNGLGIAVILLFAIIFISFLATQVSEAVNPLDSLVMVSNAFTSNGYAVLGKTIPGKINSIILVWGGYILSGVGTATLTAAILTKQFNNRFDELEKKIDKNNEE